MFSSRLASSASRPAVRLCHFTKVAGFSTSANAAKSLRLIMLGAPGSGKGTYAKLISADFGIPAISTGDLIRNAIHTKSPLADELAKATASGAFISDALVFSMLSERLAQPDCASGYILDGFPRTLTQAEMLKDITDVDLVLNITLREDVLLQATVARRSCRGCGQSYNLADINSDGIVMPPLLPRVEGVCDKCGGELYQRSDDTDAVVKKRLEVYHELTRPLIDYYGATGKLVVFDVKKGKADWPLLKPIIESRAKEAAAGKQ